MGHASTKQDAEGPPFRQLFEMHYASVWRLLRRLGVSPEGTDDAAQEVFWVAARRLPDIRPGREAAFLYGVALRVASNERRQGIKRSALHSLNEVDDIACERQNPEEQLAVHRARSLLDEALNELPDDLREVFVLKEIEQLPARAIAEICEVPPGTVASRLRRARELFSLHCERLQRAQQKGTEE